MRLAERKQLQEETEQAFEQIGEEFGMEESRCTAWEDRTYVAYTDYDNNHHTFDFPSVLPPDDDEY